MLNRLRLGDVPLDSLVQVGRPIPLDGGLRCTTSYHKLTIELVVKVGDYGELAGQVQFIERLPERFRALFPVALNLQPSTQAGEGVLIMEKIPGQSLHDFLFDPSQPPGSKLEALRLTLEKLRELHAFPLGEERCSREAGPWVARIRERVRAGIDGRAVDRRSLRIDELLLTLDAAEPLMRSSPRSAAPPLRWIHGDAQAGNFIVTTAAPEAAEAGPPQGRGGAGSRLSVRLIDPLGGSGESPGDYVYDLSRLYHWLDGVGLCYEERARPAAELEQRHGSYVAVRDRSKATVLSSLRDTAEALGDKAHLQWFFLYSAFHASGKLKDFTSPRATSALCDAISFYLRMTIGSSRLRGRSSRRSGAEHLGRSSRNTRPDLSPELETFETGLHDGLTAPPAASLNAVSSAPRDPGRESP
ncbi:phosphotransferase [Sorangium sp. So ce291]|uniref:phosphotransferase n=1 Tax=Sorangium sp. So ce291 TaxID=3133294 RepID=UPI003F60F875